MTGLEMALQQHAKHLRPKHDAGNISGRLSKLRTGTQGT